MVKFQIVEDEKPVKDSPKSSITSRPKKLVIPKHIESLFNDLDIFINSMWGMQSNNKIKWKAKFKLWLVFKEWFNEEVSK